MKNILCFGDSNTWGANPTTGDRHQYQDRWPTMLQAELGADFLVIPEGQNGRTATFEDPVEGDKYGRRHLPVLLESHAPLDLVIIMLGTNDLKRRFSAAASDIAFGVGELVNIVRKSEYGPGGSAPEVLVLIPGKLERLTGFADMFAEGARTSERLEEAFVQMAEERGVRCFPIRTVVRYSTEDGIHLGASEQRALGGAVAPEVRKILSET